MTALTRGEFLKLLTCSVSVLAFSNTAWAEDEITKDMILNDPDSPTAGNPKGDITIVDFFDYNCPYCKKSAKNLELLVKDDGKIRLVYKDWPILAPTSIIGARLALAARYQGKYLEVHQALMDIPGYGVSQDQMLDAVRKTSVDQPQLDKDVAAHADDIARTLKRNLHEAQAIGFRGTPGFLIGDFKVNEALTYGGFKQAVSDARARQAEQKTK